MNKRLLEEIKWMIFILIFAASMTGILYGFSSMAKGEELNLTLSMQSRVDVEGDSNIDVKLREFSAHYHRSNILIFADVNRVQAPSMPGRRPVGDTYSLNIDELSYNFHIYDLDWRLGKVVIPFGFDYLERVRSSVFLTTPKGTSYDYGLYISTGYDILQVESYINSFNESSWRGTLRLMNDGLITTISFNDIDPIVASYGNWSITNKFLYSSLLFNFSLVSEYLPDTGGFWTRSVVSPGIFDVIGVFGGYYNINTDLSVALDNYNYAPDSWVYGLYIDVSRVTTLSTEWNSNAALPPTHIRLTTRF